MNRDRTSDAAKRVKGSIKEAIGKLTGARKTEAEGTVDKAAGKAGNAVDKAASTKRGTLPK